MFGPGIYLLFKFLKYSTIIFGVISLLAIVNVFLLKTSHPDHSALTEDSFKIILLKTTV